MTSRTIKNPPTLDHIVWSDVADYRLSVFVDQFTLPQVVKVTEGYHGTNEDSCIGIDQILALHSVKTTEKALARDRENTELYIPLNCSRRVELAGDMGTATRLRKYKFYRVTQEFSRNFSGKCVPVCHGDKLEVVRVERGVRGKEDCIHFQNQNGMGFVRLPLTATKGLQPLIDGREYYLKELSVTKLPVYFQFIDPPKPVGHLHRAENVFNSSLGVLKLEQVYQDSSVICTTKEGNMKTVVTCPKTLPITVAVAQGALVGDKDYARMCRLFHEGVSLNRIENMESENIYASPDSIRQYQYIDVTERPPPVYPRIPKGRTTEPRREASKETASTQDIVKPGRPSECSLSPVTTEQVDERKDGAENIYEDPDKYLMFTKTLTGRARMPKPTSGPDARTVTDSNIPGQMSQMSMNEVSDFLTSWHLGQFVDVFSGNDVDGEILVSMNTQEMNDLGMNSFQSKKLLRLISGWRPKNDSP